MARSHYRRNARRDDELRELIDQGVMAGAEVMRDAVREKFEERDLGYTDGEFARGYAADIEIGPLYTDRGVRRADVFTAATRPGSNGDVPYPAMWEFGHFNLFIDPAGGTYVRVETFGPAMMENIDNVEGAMVRRIRLWNGRVTRRSGRLSVGISRRDFGL